MSRDTNFDFIQIVIRNDNWSLIYENSKTKLSLKNHEILEFSIARNFILTLFDFLGYSE